MNWSWMLSSCGLCLALLQFVLLVLPVLLFVAVAPILAIQEIVKASDDDIKNIRPPEA